MAQAALTHSNGTLFYNASLAATAIKDITTGAATVQAVAIDAGSADDLFVKLYDAIAPTVGTTEPEVILYAEGSGGTNGGHSLIDFRSTVAGGVSLSTAITLAAVDNVGAADGPGKTGTTAPTGACKVAVLTA